MSERFERLTKIALYKNSSFLFSKLDVPGILNSLPSGNSKTAELHIIIIIIITIEHLSSALKSEDAEALTYVYSTGADFHRSTVASGPGGKLVIGRRSVRNWTQLQFFFCECELRVIINVIDVMICSSQSVNLLYLL